MTYRFHKLNDLPFQNEEYELESPADESTAATPSQPLLNNFFPPANGSNSSSRQATHERIHWRNASVPNMGSRVSDGSDPSGFRPIRQSISVDNNRALMGPYFDTIQEEVDQIDLPSDPNENITRLTIEADDMQTGWKRKLFSLMEDPSSSREAFVIHVIVNTLIVMSALLTTIETIPAIRSTGAHVWFSLETILVALFTVEYVLRVLAHSDSTNQLFKWVISPYAIIDLIATLPYYVELIFRRDTTYEFRFTILRTFRLLRVFRAFRYSSTLLLTIEVFIVATRRSTDALVALFFFIFTSIILFSTLMYFAERGIWNEETQTFVGPDGYPSPFDSIPSSGWFFLATVTTTGYGDIVPRTWLGKVIALPMMLCGLLMIALPSLILSRNFAIVWEAFQMRRRNNLEMQGPGSPGVLMDSDDVDNHELLTNGGTQSHSSTSFDVNMGQNARHRILSATELAYTPSNADLARQVSQLSQEMIRLSELNVDLIAKIDNLFARTGEKSL